MQSHKQSSDWGEGGQLCARVVNPICGIWRARALHIHLRIAYSAHQTKGHTSGFCQLSKLLLEVNRWSASLHLSFACFLCQVPFWTTPNPLQDG
jgi:hypothetical protein